MKVSCKKHLYIMIDAWVHVIKKSQKKATITTQLDGDTLSSLSELDIESCRTSDLWETCTLRRFCLEVCHVKSSVKGLQKLMRVDLQHLFELKISEKVIIYLTYASSIFSRALISKHMQTKFRQSKNEFIQRRFDLAQHNDCMLDSLIAQVVSQSSHALLVSRSQTLA